MINITVPVLVYIQQIEDKLKKMAETIQIVRTVLGMKIQSESRKVTVFEYITSRSKTCLNC